MTDDALGVALCGCFGEPCDVRARPQAAIGSVDLPRRQRQLSCHLSPVAGAGPIRAPAAALDPAIRLERAGGRVVTPITADAARPYDVRLSADVWRVDRTACSSVTVSPAVSPGDHELRRIPTSKLGVVLEPALDRLEKLRHR